MKVGSPFFDVRLTGKYKRKGSKMSKDQLFWFGVIGGAIVGVSAPFWFFILMH